GAYSAKAATDGTDWLVLRVAPGGAPKSLPAAYKASGNMLETTMRWAIEGSEQHEFQQPISVVLVRTGEGSVVPATRDDSDWRVIPHVPVDGQLPASWSDGFYTSTGRVHILTRHLSQFTQPPDDSPPAAP